MSKTKQQSVAKKSESTNEFQVQKIAQLISPAYKLQTVTNTEIKPKNNDIQPGKKYCYQIWRGKTVDVSPLDGSFEMLQKTAEKQKVTVLNIQTVEQLIDKQQLKENEKEKNNDQNTNNSYNDLAIQNQSTKENLSGVMMENGDSIYESQDWQSENQVVQTLQQSSQVQQNSNSNIKQTSNYNETDNSLDKTSTTTLIENFEKNQEKASVNNLIQRKFYKWTDGVDQFASEEILNIESLRNFGKIGFGLMPCSLMQKYEDGSGLSYVPQNVEHVIFRNENERIRVIFLVQGQGISESANELDVEVLRISLSHEFKASDNVKPEQKITTNNKISSFFETPNGNLITWNQYFGDRNTEYFRFNTEKNQWRQFQAIEKRIQVDQSNGIMIRCAGGIVITLQMVKGPKTSKSQIQKIVQEQKPNQNSDDEDLDEQEVGEESDDNNKVKKEMSKTKLFCLQSEFYSKGKFYGVECRYDLFGNLYDYGFSYSVQNQKKKLR